MCVTMQVQVFNQQELPAIHVKRLKDTLRHTEQQVILLTRLSNDFNFFKYIVFIFNNSGLENNNPGRIIPV